VLLFLSMTLCTLPADASRSMKLRDIKEYSDWTDLTTECVR